MMLGSAVVQLPHSHLMCKAGLNIQDKNNNQQKTEEKTSAKEEKKTSGAAHF
jgi:hypothetical protein